MKFHLLVLILFLLTACGSGGGGSGGASISSTNALESSGIVNKLWAIPIASTQYGNCAVAFKLGNNNRFGLTFICEQSQNTFKYEVIYGSFTISGDSIELFADADNCSSYKTIFWDPNDNEPNIYKFHVSGQFLSVYTSNSVLSFQDFSTLVSQDTFPYIASRGCFINNNGTYQWSNYSGSSVDNVFSEINQTTENSSTNTSSNSQQEKAKIDIIIFQDYSDSMRAPV
ncbi:MAG: hypothetical protein M9962_10835, partial [Oligoflexia bacterium]|nr:hypothetical protein [Oligoflexia bacterium]